MRQDEKGENDNTSSQILLTDYSVAAMSYSLPAPVLLHQIESHPFPPVIKAQFNHSPLFPSFS